MLVKARSYTTHIQDLWVTSFGFVNKPSVDLYQDIYQDRPLKLVFTSVGTSKGIQVGIECK